MKCTGRELALRAGEHTAVKVWSGGYDAPSFGRISVKGEAIMSNSQTSRGVNLVVVDSSGKVCAPTVTAAVTAAFR